jgi:hypothetical protein
MTEPGKFDFTIEKKDAKKILRTLKKKKVDPKKI